MPPAQLSRTLSIGRTVPLDFSGDDAFSFSGQRGGDANDLMKTPLLALVLLTSKLSAGDWSHWRGETRDDVSTEDSGFDSGAWPPADDGDAVGLRHGGVSEGRRLAGGGVGQAFQPAVRGRRVRLESLTYAKPGRS